MAALQASGEPSVLKVGKLRIEMEQYRAWMNGAQLKLSNSEFKLLECLSLEANSVVPLEDLKATHGLEAGFRDASSLLRRMIRSLRRKMGFPAGDIGCIKTVRGVSYRLVPLQES